MLVPRPEWSPKPPRPSAATNTLAYYANLGIANFRSGVRQEWKQGSSDEVEKGLNCTEQ